MAVGSCCVVVMSAISGSGSDIIWLLAKLVVVVTSGQLNGSLVKHDTLTGLYCMMRQIGSVTGSRVVIGSVGQ